MIIFCGRFGDGWKIRGGRNFNFDNDNENCDFDVDGEFMLMIVMNFNDSDMVLTVNLVKFIMLVIVFLWGNGCRKILVVNLIMGGEI